MADACPIAPRPIANPRLRGCGVCSSRGARQRVGFQLVSIRAFAVLALQPRIRSPPFHPRISFHPRLRGSGVAARRSQHRPADPGVSIRAFAVLALQLTSSVGLWLTYDVSIRAFAVLALQPSGTLNTWTVWFQSAPSRFWRCSFAGLMTVPYCA